MDEINAQFLFPLWGHTITEQKIDLASKSIHFTLVATDDGVEVRNQIDIENIRMFCYGTDECCVREDSRDTDCSFPESHHEGTWNEITEIEAAVSGLANVKVYFNYSKNVPSPYFNVDQNIVIDFPDAILTVSAKKIIINGVCFVWNTEDGSFAPKDTGTGLLSDIGKSRL